MTGGMYFGPPGWALPACPLPPFTPLSAPLARPNNRLELRDFTTHIGLGQTHPWLPALADQIMALAERPARRLIITGLAMAPESRIGALCASVAAPAIVSGIDLIASALGHPPATLVTDRADRAAFRPLRRAARGRYRVRQIVARYPAAHPAILARLLFGCQAAEPISDSIVIIDILTCMAMGMAAEQAVRFSHRPVQIFIAGIPPRVIWSPIGARVHDVFVQAGIDPGRMECIANGMMAGSAVDMGTAAIHGATETLSLRSFPAAELQVDCIRCAWCVQSCPTSINPAALFAASAMVDCVGVGDPKSALACIGCGLCTYVCPSRIPLAAVIQELRSRVEFNVVGAARGINP